MKKSEGKTTQPAVQKQKDIITKLSAELKESKIEAGIEAALDRVRIVAMKMRKPPDLSRICEKIFKELKQLGFIALRNTEIIINHNAKHTITSYYYSDYGVTGVIELDYRSNPVVKKWAKDLKKSRTAFAEVVIPEKEMKQWRKYRKEIGYLPDPKLNRARTVFYYSYSIGLGALSISSFKPISKEQIEILKRFRNVFDLAYQRYADIAKAEAQAREAQIEAVLERVRAVALSMKEPADMLDVCHTISDQLKLLQIQDIRNVQTIIIYESKFEYINYQYFTPYDKNSVEQIDYRLHPVELALARKMLSSPNAFYFKIFKGKELRIWRDHRRATHQLPDPLLDKTQAAYYYFYSIGSGAIGVTAFSRLTDEALFIFRRFRNVFKLTYRRYIDIQKAEAQAREAQIEASLERVRARTMAMHKSAELSEVAVTIHKELIALEVTPFIGVGYVAIDEKNNTQHGWTTKPGGSLMDPYHLPLTGEPGMQKRYEAWKRKDDLFWQELGGEKLKRHIEFASPHFGSKEVEEIVKNFFPDPTIFYCSNFSHGYLSLITGKRMTEEEETLFTRFRKVFEQSYARFLDLQKAEAQARESQIQLALERVRARTMAMQHSSELKEAASLLFQQVKKLGIDAWTCGYNIWDEDKKTVMAWLSRDTVTSAFKIPQTENPTLLHFYEAAQKGESLFVEEVSGETLTELYRYLGTLLVSEGVVNEVRGPGYAAPTFQVNHAAYFSYGYLLFVTYKPYPEAHDIFKRFAAVFDQTYTRFLDLQKAEAQAREAQIEAALERVRSRSIGMQKSEELKEVIQVIYDQLLQLNFEIDNMGFLMDYRESDDYNIWTTGANGILPDLLHIPYFDHPFTRDYINQRDSGPEHFAKTYSFEEKNKWWEMMFKSITDLPEEIKDALLNERLHSPGLALSRVFTNNIGIYLLNFSGTPYSEAENTVVVRFAKVFEQTYTRFLDLQKAEAQARESQIQLALERVRARTMAMQRSDELSEAASLLFQQVQSLGAPSWTAGYCVWDEDKKAITLWMSSPSGSIQPPFRAPTDENPFFIHYLEADNKGMDLYIEENSGEELEKFYQYLHSLPVVREILDSAKAEGHPLPTYEVDHCAFFSKGFLLFVTYQQVPELHDIFKRFAAVFDQTYTRFLDLQKAEAQAREAQIELALERVRARTMAMHKSEELSEVSALLYNELQGLGVTGFINCGYVEIDEAANLQHAWMTNADGSGLNVAQLPLTGDPVFDERYDAWKRKEQIFHQSIRSDLLKNHIEFATQHFRKTEIDELVRIRFSDPTIFYCSNFSHGYLHIVTNVLLSDEAESLLIRFTRVFEMTYKRFLDLQKAEAQAREAQIEAALERVRSRTMAMHQTSELQEVIHTLHKELLNLNLSIYGGSFVVINEDVGPELRCWGSGGTANTSEEIQVPHFNMPFCTNLVKGIKSGPGFFIEEFSQKDKKKYFTKLFEHKPWSDLSNDQKNKTLLSPGGYTRSVAVSKYTSIFIINHNGKKFTDAENDILRRFAKVFEQTYTRFLDLQKAEAQAREAQIEASLERVRSKTMAMHNSQDVGDTVASMFDELVRLDIETIRCGIGILDEAKQMELWTAKRNIDGNVELIVGHLNMMTHSLLQGVYDGWKRKLAVFSYELKGDDLVDYFTKLVNSPDYHIKYDLASLPQKQFHNAFYFPEGALYVFSEEQLPVETSQIFKRFAGVFGQTYRRYLDLLRAEAQVREAQIEAGLERVRARTMAMHSSEDVSVATATMFTELERLGIENFRGGITNIYPDRTQDVWSVNNLAEGKIVKAVGRFNIDDHPFWQFMYQEWVNKKDFVYYFLAGKEKEDYIKVLNATQGYLPQAIQQFPDVHFQVYTFNEGGVWTNSLKPHSEEDKQIMKRFASVFSLTFRRYQDLKKAETQAREATIEAALEKVRGKAMAMHNSNDLSSTASMVFTELRKLGINPIRCGVGLLTKESRKAQLYSATSSTSGDSLSLVGWVMLTEHPVLVKIYDAWMAGEDYFPELSGEELKTYYEQLLSGLSVPKFPDWQSGEIQYGHFIRFPIGCLYAWSETRYNDDEIKILKRFASIIDLTFRRYLELQQSEANAKEAIKQAALDRIRADIASMRTISDLDRITPLIWNELTILGLPFIRCGVFIMDESQQLIHTFLSTPEGKAIAAFHLPYNTPGNFAEVVNNWRHKKIYIDQWTKPDFISMADTLVKQGAIQKPEQYLNTLPADGFYLHFIPFLQGMLYVGNTDKLGENEISLIESVADAFSTAYARYEDFNKLEAAKQQVEKTLTDLKQAQQQLVQSEKMASLGELTAGIAHEIQNPLNFVNNFSDVSNELLEEMKTELAKGNTEDALAIAEDVKQNLEKILHHGKRADGIVKGMLQHSRSSSGVKELVDINALCDEYLRLAFHGLRAKDKSFNAKFETDLDTSIEKINVVPQEIGRVILNLINNAFYAVTEKRKLNQEGYEPVVSVSTKKENGNVEVRVRDNGTGIPQKVLDKIFQPFFTTKPTGQGTGLGLSLSYDIVKAHGGEIKVETKEGDGTEFIIMLPR